MQRNKVKRSVSCKGYLCPVIGVVSLLICRREKATFVVYCATLRKIKNSLVIVYAGFLALR